MKQALIRWSLPVLALAIVLPLGLPTATYAQTPPQEQPTPRPKGPKPPPGIHPQGPPSRFAEGEILVKFKPGARGQDVADAHRRNGGQEADVIPEIDVRVVRVPRGQEVSRSAAYAQDPAVLYAEVNGFYSTTQDPAKPPPPNDEHLGRQWQYENPVLKADGTDADIDAPGAWNGTKDKGGVPIAILDSGIDQDHPDLQAKIAYNRNFTRSRTADDNLGHGTHVAGSAAAMTNNEKGVAGTCPQCTLFNIKVLGDDGYGQWDWIARGINDAANRGAKVISMSLGGSYDSRTVRDAVTYAWGKGVVLTAAAGNSNYGAADYPARYDGVIAVAATDSADNRASFSNWGWAVDVAASGVSILSTAPNHGTVYWPQPMTYAYLDGTSMATPHVAGIAGLVWATGLCSTAGVPNQCVRDRVEQKSEPIAGTLYDGTPQYEYPHNLWSWGRVNALSSITP